MALCMIEEAEKRGDLKPGGTIVDQSTGNTGPALSFVGAVKGYEVQIFWVWLFWNRENRPFSQ